ncbi:hypothetical protein FGO68_gene5241 [Halteria grandinella]|uniref:EamA domain-containing protein n=1 Tax=Halteria grandinella TaxID=5974 RepID=A0A8J8NQ14_HALGN|nr:hypothetical protein FGO68_gene5241 [Halteria grandinella]
MDEYQAKDVNIAYLDASLQGGEIQQNAFLKARNSKHLNNMSIEGRATTMDFPHSHLMVRSKTPQSNIASFQFEDINQVKNSEVRENASYEMEYQKFIKQAQALHNQSVDQETIPREVSNRSVDHSQESKTISRATSSLKEHYDTMKGLICGFLAATSAGISLDLIKVLLFYTNISEFELIYQRSLIALVIVGFVLYIGGHSPFNISRDVGMYAAIRVLGSCGGFMMQIFALDFIPVSKSVLIINNPFLTSLISFVLIGERSSKHDYFCFFLCTIGVILLTDPFQESLNKGDDLKNMIGTSLAFISSLSFNISYVALRRLSNKQINSWILVFHIMTANLMVMPACFLSYDVAYRHQFTQYTDKVWIILLLVGLLTVSTLYFTHLMFYYENAARGAAYTNFELIYTYFFDVFIMKDSFRLLEFMGAGLIIFANMYLYIMKTLGFIS